MGGGRAAGGGECRRPVDSGPTGKRGEGGGKRGSCFSGRGMGARYSAESWAEHAESLGDPTPAGISVSLCIYLNESLCTCI